jgi:RsiW-degrading membrane proteinase PrsW (M82 family)
MNRRRLILLVGWLVVFLVTSSPVWADAPPPDDDLALAERFAPVFYFHPAELFRPQPVDVIVEQARLRQSRRLWFDINVLRSVDVLDLLDLHGGPDYFLDVWYGDSGSSKYINYSAHRAYYQAVLAPEAGGPQVAVYAHVARDQVEGHIVLQYWALYFYNDWFNKHEGDWEMVQVVLNAREEPEWAVFSQHHGGTRRPWAQVRVEEGTHPAVYVALGSHANYFVGDEIYAHGRDIGHTRVEILDRTGRFGRVMPEVIMIPDRPDLLAAPEAWPGAEWLPFRGHWGEGAPQSDFAGPLGPADKGLKWERPYTWGMDQPLDTDVWYANRLRVEVVGAAPGEALVGLRGGDGSPLPSVEILGNLAILHTDPPTETGVVASIFSSPGVARDVVATWPDAAAGQVTWYRFADVPFAAPGRGRLELIPGASPRLIVEGGGPEETDAVLEPSRQETVAATWDAPDMVWIGGILPAPQVGLGLLIGVLASVVPTLVYVGALYWMDRYEKEPRRLLMAAFVWGAVPSVALVGVAELFFRLPPDLLGPETLEAVRLGLLAPVLTEALKGAAVLFLSWRYRLEFDGVLDGIIYGATVGFGFAMTGNLISNLSSFALWGFDAFSAGQLGQGVVQAADQALYAAIFGASLGLAQRTSGRWRRWAVAGGGFTLAVVVHSLHRWLAYRLLGLNVVTLLSSLAGIVVVGFLAGWSLARERRFLVEELDGELPPHLYRAVVTPSDRRRALWRALWRNGWGAWQRLRGLHQLCAELAFGKRWVRQHPDDGAAVARLERLREELQAELAQGEAPGLIPPRG